MLQNLEKSKKGLCSEGVGIECPGTLSVHGCVDMISWRLS